MSLEHLIAFNLALFAALASPGPAMLLSMHTSLAQGRRAGMATGIGLALAACLWTLAALMGLQALFAVAPWLYLSIKIVGAVYLLYIAYRMWRDADAPLAPADAALHGRSAVLRGAFVNLLNPKSVLFAAALLVVIFPQDMEISSKLLIVGNHFIIETAFYTALAYGMSRPAVAARYLRFKKALDRTASVVLGALGVRLLVSR